MSKIIYFEQHRPVLLTRVTDADLFLDAYVDSDGQKYVAILSTLGLRFIPLFEDGAQIMEYGKKYGSIKRRCAVSQAQAVGVME
jgi:hypothetical protein